MSGEFGRIIAFPTTTMLDMVGIQRKIDNALSLLRAIDAGQMLAALPECDLARKDHLAALRLLSLTEQELLGLQREVDLAGVADSISPKFS
jgi:hypothetical protein